MSIARTPSDFGVPELLLLATAPTRLALPAAAVRELVRLSDWDHGSPIPLDRILSVHFVTREPGWVLRLGSGTRTLDAYVSGRVQIFKCASNDFLPMPAWIASGFSKYSNLVAADGEAFALVIKIAALLDAHAEMSKHHDDQESNS